VDTVVCTELTPQFDDSQEQFRNIPSDTGSYDDSNNDRDRGIPRADDGNEPRSPDHGSLPLL